jgi:hypothetical protein
VQYLTGSVTGVTRHLDSGTLGFMKTPTTGDIVRPGWTWAADNGCFGKNYVGDDRWFAWLQRFTEQQRATCLFATAPDVVGDAAATLERSQPWLPRIRALGYKAALVAQDGLTPDTTPWETFDVLFIGGSTSWKLGSDAQTLIAAAKARGKFVHVGRVNSMRRFSMMSHLGVDSVDGTYIAFGPDKNAGNVLGWVRWHKQQPALFGGNT